jgi:Cu+-exporting ATPase
MHPEIKQNSPGICPKCGMNLENIIAPSPHQVIYTCPIHPEIQQDHPGLCLPSFARKYFKKVFPPSG